MELTAVQQRTSGVLIRPPPSDRFPDGFVAALRDDLEARLLEIDPPEPIWIRKARLNMLGRCEGLLAADLAGEREAFAYRRDTTIGTITHRAAQADIAGERTADPHVLVEYALTTLLEG